MTLLVRQPEIRHRVRHVLSCGIKVAHNWLSQWILGILVCENVVAIVV